MYNYYVFYKPYLTLCQFSPEGDKRTLAHYLPGMPKDVYPVGRLDYDSEGLLILTDDKTLTELLLTPRHGHRRTYYVQVEGEITLDALTQLREGIIITIDGKPYRTKKALTEILFEEPPLPPRDPPIRFRKSVPTTWLSLTLTEGKNRQVRRMTAAAGFPTLRLVRFAMGTVTINGMEPGTYKHFGPEIKQLLARGK
ncbi:MAG: pseudouridine synthase [Taibaiella sp.]|nr:pseudouridine synthase [Taibaiella sp.]